MADDDCSPERYPWLFSPMLDLVAFTGSALLALGIVVIAFYGGWLDQETPEWLWVISILMVDVAHVYATGFRVYFDRRELSRRPWVYLLVPLLAFLLGAAIYSESPSLFWRVLAYIAVFHFIRQQYGWVALYRAKEESGCRMTKPMTKNSAAIDRWIDMSVIYLATIYPLVYWHTHSRRFHWFVAGDFIEIPQLTEAFLKPVYWASLLVYVGWTAYRGITIGRWNPGKDLVVVTTAVCWYVGIVGLDSDIAFTVTNVLTHGIPYGFLTACDAQKRRMIDSASSRSNRKSYPMWFVVRFLILIWSLAFIEEFLWDCSVWHERPWLFGDVWLFGQSSLLRQSWENLGIHSLLVPLLSVPQITHYLLDGFIWKRRSNPEFAKRNNLEIEKTDV